MAKPIKVRRAGMFRAPKKVKFRAWLDTQPRAKLTYKKEIEQRDENGWTAEDFVREAQHRGVEARIMTVYKWCSGTHPRHYCSELQKIFKGIQF